MRITASVTLLLCVLTGSAFAGKGNEFAGYVNPFIGTGGHGHTYPGASAPFGMVQLSPDTRTQGWDACAGYHYSDSIILGFSHTHLSGTGVADYGDILVRPSVGLPSGPGLRFRHADEVAAPAYYRVRFRDEGITAEMAAGVRVGFHRYTFPATDSATLTFDLLHGLGDDRLTGSEMNIINDHEISGFRRSTGWAKDELVYFNAVFSRPFLEYKCDPPDSTFPKGSAGRCHLRFSTAKVRQVMVKVGLSFVDADGARKNREFEVGGWNFDHFRSSMNRAWNEELRAIQVSGGNDKLKQTFYTALYHVMLTPNIASDVDGRYRGMDGAVHRAEGFIMYSVFSLWDTFRAEHPLLTIIDPKRSVDFVRSLLAKYRESGLLPVWELASNETWTMIGYHAVPVIADAYVKGILNFDPRGALEAMKKSAMRDQAGLDAYRTCGFVPGDRESESVSKTLEYAYDDWCIAQMAKLLRDRPDDSVFTTRAQYYKNLFDPTAGFFRARQNGAWVTPFDPTSVTFHYTEANAWQYSFFVPQDLEGLITLMGGREAFGRKLDSLFLSPPRLTGREQADISGLIGQYAQGNEPSHHVAYLYNAIGQPWKTASTVRTIMDSLYTSGPDGLCGNDDCGQMSAWYVMSAAGFYQVCPGTPEYALGSPLFSSIKIRTAPGRYFTITAKGCTHERKFISRAMLNGKEYTKSYLTHNDMVRGGSLTLAMSNRPSSSWGTRPGDIQPSVIEPTIATDPLFASTVRAFSDSLEVRISPLMDHSAVYYSVGNADTLVERGIRYEGPIVVHENTSINAVAKREGVTTSGVVRAQYVKHRPAGRIRYATQYSPQYTGGGENALVDGIEGSEDFHLGAWQGFAGSDLQITLELDHPDTLRGVTLGCLQDINSWIFFPAYVECSLSADGKVFGKPVQIINNVPVRDDKVQIHRFTMDFAPAFAGYVKVHAKNIGICPPWHKGAGGLAWVFVDELEVTPKQ